MTLLDEPMDDHSISKIKKNIMNYYNLDATNLNYFFLEGEITNSAYKLNDSCLFISIIFALLLANKFKKLGLKVHYPWHFSHILSLMVVLHGLILLVILDALPSPPPIGWSTCNKCLINF